MKSNIRILEIDGWLIYILSTILYGFLSFSINYAFISDNLYYQSFGEQIALERIDKIIEFSGKWEWASYAVLPIIIIIRVFYTSVFLFIGIFFTELKADFSKLFKIALLADFVYVLAGLVKLVILIFFREVNTLQDLQFQPLSAMELFNTRTIDPLFVYPLSLLNVFELGYFMLLAWLLVGVVYEAKEERTLRFRQSLKLVTA